MLRTLRPLRLLWEIKEAVKMVRTTSLVVFRDKRGEEYPVTKIKIAGYDKIVLCEDADG